MQHFLTGQFVIWLPKIVSALVLILATILYGKINLPKLTNWNLSVRKFIFFTLAFQVAYAILLTGLQYYVWSHNPFTKILLEAHLDRQALVGIAAKFFWLFDHKLGYFLFYVWSRFWLRMVWTWVAAYVFYWLLRGLAAFREDFFLDQELDLGLLTCLLPGWPYPVIFLPLVFVFLLILVLVRRIFFQDNTATLGWPLIIAAAIVVIFGDQLLILFNLTILRI